MAEQNPLLLGLLGYQQVQDWELVLAEGICHIDPRIARRLEAAT